MSIERVGHGLNTITEILQRPTLDPDPARQDWALYREELAALVSAAEQEVLAPLDAALAELGGDEEQVEKVRNVCADRIGDAAGLLLAAQNREPARRLLQAASSAASPGPTAELLAAGLADPERFVMVIRAWWLMQQQRRDEATVVARAAAKDAPSAIANAVRAIVDAPRPLNGAPSLFGINGFGLRVYGHRDPRPDGTYITTRFVTALFVPLLPLDAFRVSAGEDGGWYFLGKESLSPLTRWWRRLAALGLVLAIVGALVSNYLSSPSHRLAVAIEAAQAAEAASGPEGRAAVIDQYEAILLEFPEANPKDLGPVIEAFVRLAAAEVESPLTVERMAEVKRIMLRYRALPDAARAPRQAEPMIATLEQWAAELGTESAESILAAIELLGDAQALASPSESTRIRDRRNELNRMLAAGLADEWPLEAIRQYVAMPDDDEAVAAAGKLLEALGDGPSVWIELAPTIDRWARVATRTPTLTTTHALVVEQLSAAQAAMQDPERVALLAQPEAVALAAALATSPGDQELAVALAELKLAEDDTQGALAVLEAIGPPGRMVLTAQATLAAGYAAAGREAEADALLERVLTSRLPAFESAQRIYSERAEAVSDRLIREAQQGHIPPTLQRKLEAAPESEQPEIFREWLAEQVDADLELTRLRDEYVALTGVVGLAIQWGTIKLRRANAEQGQARQELLDGAERAFLAIGREGSGIPSYHLGLGQVYYRLGKEQEGERELQSLLDDEPPEIRLAVASTYRELGLTARAREVAEKIYAESESPMKESAAQLIAVMTVDREDNRLWLGRADQTKPFVRLGLLELEANEQLSQGHYAEADAKLAQVAAGWAEQSQHDSAAANNAALAMLARYGCTGELARLREAVALLEKARSLAPDNALVVGNLGSSIEMLASVELLETWLHPQHLLLSATEQRDLVGALVAGPDQARARKQMSASQTLRRAIDMIQQEQVLRPKDARPYQSLLMWHARRADDKALAQLARIVATVQVDLTDETASANAIMDGSQDATGSEQLAQRLEHFETIGRAVERHGHGPTRAASTWLKADAQHSLAFLRDDAAAARRAVETFASAHAQWDGLDTRRHAVALVDLAILQAMEGSAPLREAYGQQRRRLGHEGFLAWLLQDSGEALAAVRAQPELAEAIALRRDVDPARMDTFDWLLARLGSDATLLAASQPALARPENRAYYEIGAKLVPYPEGLELLLALIDAPAAR